MFVCLFLFQQDREENRGRRREREKGNGSRHGGRRGLQGKIKGAKRRRMGKGAV